MHVSYPYLTDEQLESQRPVLADGDHPFQTVVAESATSKNGNPMIVLTNKVFDDEGREFEVRDWIVLTETAIFKLKHYSESVKKPQLYNKEGRLNINDFTGCCGHVKTKLREDKNGVMRPSITDYVEKKAESDNGNIASAQKEPDVFEDDIKF